MRLPQKIAWSQARRQAGSVRLARNSNATPRKMSARQDQEQRKVEAAEQRRIPVREGRESGATGYEQPHLVAVPDRADRVDQHARRSRSSRPSTSEQDADTEVEPFQHES